MTKKQLIFFNRGWALATADRIRRITIDESMQAAGLTIDELKKSGVDNYDMKPIEKEI